VTATKGLSGYADDRYTAQRRAGFSWLRFAPALEREYRGSYVQLNATRIRAASVTGLCGVFGFLLVDQLLGSNLQPALADWLLICVTVPALLVPLAATFWPGAGPYLLHFVFAGVLLTALSVLGIISVGQASNAWFPYESLYLLTMFVYFVSGLTFYQAIFCALTLALVFVATNWRLIPHQVLLYEGYYLLLANAFGVMGHYILERQSRLGWLLQNELRQQAALDSLTGLLNHRAFNVHLETVWLHAQRSLTPVALMLIDLDHFKQINDSAGHQFGDSVLQQVAKVLKGCAQRPLDAAGRYGGDELVAVWFGADGDWVAKMTQELPARLAGLQTPDARAPIPVTVSGGAVLAWPRPGLAVEEAIKAADELLYEMKNTQRGTIGFKVLGPPVAVGARQSAA